MEQGQNADNDWEASTSDDRNRKRSSILKVTKRKSGELDTTDFTVQLTRRVSFASNNFVKPFAADPEKNTIWDNTYEEALPQSDSEHTGMNDMKKAINFDLQTSDMELTCAYSNLYHTKMTRFNKTIMFDKQGEDMELTCNYSKVLIQEKENICLQELMQAQEKDRTLHIHDPKSYFCQTIHQTMDMALTLENDSKNELMFQPRVQDEEITGCHSPKNDSDDNIANIPHNLSIVPAAGIMCCQSIKKEEVQVSLNDSHQCTHDSKTNFYTTLNINLTPQTENEVGPVTANYTKQIKNDLKCQQSYAIYMDDNIGNNPPSQTTNEPVTVTLNNMKHTENQFMKFQTSNCALEGGNIIENNPNLFVQDISSFSPTTENEAVAVANNTKSKLLNKQPCIATMAANVKEVSHDFDEYVIFRQNSESSSHKLLIEEECPLVDSPNISDNAQLDIDNFVEQPVGNPISRVIYSEAAIKPTTPIADNTQDFEFSHSVHSTTVDTTQTLMAQIKLLENEPPSNMSIRLVTTELDENIHKNPFLDIIKDKLVKFEFTPIDYMKHERELAAIQILCKEITSRQKSIKHPRVETISDILTDFLKNDSTLSSTESFVPKVNKKKRLNSSMVREKISEISSKTLQSIQLKGWQKNVLNFSMFHRACYMIVQIDSESFEVLNIKTFNCLKENPNSLTEFLTKLSQNNLHSFLGPHFDLVSLLDYVYMTLEANDH
ncbi:uncharacterized protein LOC132700841 [Cylas formicarius]|uniref:uncharacterized protein LOC132700841 n=1 Tax=Cylas formicarius TaxID=197179 RepID=UPI0029583F0C|nr:uncharacterized protein LOC132700841 [Cylas formicarius]